LGISFEEVGFTNTLLLKDRRIGFRLRWATKDFRTLNPESPSLDFEIAENGDADPEQLVLLSTALGSLERSRANRGDLVAILDFGQATGRL
jgi:hypothetical protein